MSVYNIVNQRVTDFIKNNSGNDIVVQIKKASDEKDRETFSLLLQQIKEIIRIEDEIKREKKRIQSHIASIKDIKREIRREIRIKENLLKNKQN